MYVGERQKPNPSTYVLMTSVEWVRKLQQPTDASTNYLKNMYIVIMDEWLTGWGVQNFFPHPS